MSTAVIISFSCFARSSPARLLSSARSLAFVLHVFQIAVPRFSPNCGLNDATAPPMPFHVSAERRTAFSAAGSASYSAMYCRASSICHWLYPLAISSASVYGFWAFTALSPVLLPSAAASSTPLFPIRIRLTSVRCFGSASIHRFSRVKSLNLSSSSAFAVWSLMACAPCASTPSLPLRRRCAAFWLSFAPRTTAAGVPLSVCSHSGWFCRCTVGSFFPVLAVAAAVWVPSICASTRVPRLCVAVVVVFLLPAVPVVFALVPAFTVLNPVASGAPAVTPVLPPLFAVLAAFVFVLAFAAAAAFLLASSFSSASRFLRTSSTLQPIFFSFLPSHHVGHPADHIIAEPQPDQVFRNFVRALSLVRHTLRLVECCVKAVSIGAVHRLHRAKHRRAL